MYVAMLMQFCHMSSCYGILILAEVTVRVEL